MANWQDLKQYISNTYKVGHDGGGFLILYFDLDGGRSQGVFVNHSTLQGGQEDWAIVESPIGKVEDLSLTQVVREAGSMVCGGVGMMEHDDATWVTLRHAIPLANLDVNEFDRPMNLVVTSADRLERMLTGGDSF